MCVQKSGSFVFYSRGPVSLESVSAGFSEISEPRTLKHRGLAEAAFKRAEVLGWEVGDKEPGEAISFIGEAGRIAAADSLGMPGNIIGFVVGSAVACAMS